MNYVHGFFYFFFVGDEGSRQLEKKEYIKKTLESCVETGRSMTEGEIKRVGP